ncbi:MAG: hypothetical protein IJ870_02880 [Alphaproteobacteria bacterium]|nr:hypothetical protein [Alphaproteobacteria bacterium]
MTPVLTFFKKRACSLILGGAALFVFAPTLVSAQVFGAPSETPATPSSIAQKVQAQGGMNNVQIKPVLPASSAYEPQDKDDEYIIIYMRNFNINKTLSGFTNCSMRFFVKSGLSTRISNLSFRLKWPNMETPLSFDNIEPNATLYQDYALLGNGCYQMDKAPNVIVNRCRVKDMSQQTCTSKIHWAQ